MDRRLENIIMDHAPDYWKTGVGATTTLLQNSEEYQEISMEVLQCMNGSSHISIRSICRHQNVYDLAQVLVREQHLVHFNQSETYYRVCIIILNTVLL